MPRGSCYPLLDVTVFCGGGCHYIAMEPSLRFYRPQASSSQRYPRLGGSHDLIWPVANILDSGSEVCTTLLNCHVNMPTSCGISRFLAGALNGNIGAMKSMLAEITDETNTARAFGIVPLSWAIGNAVGYVSSLLTVFGCIHR